MKSDRRFGQFVRQCSENPLLKKKGVPECILFVTTRLVLLGSLIFISAAMPNALDLLRLLPSSVELLLQFMVIARELLFLTSQFVAATNLDLPSGLCFLLEVYLLRLSLAT